MERLTEHHVNKSLGAYMVCSMTCDNSICRVDCREILKIIDRLAAYEDIGLMPDEIDSVFINSVMEENKRIKELTQAEKDGQLVVLPCKIGDTVYIIRDKKIIIATVESIHRWISGKWKLSVHTDKRYTHWIGYEVSIDDFGKTAFLTREEAEAALKKMWED